MAQRRFLILFQSVCTATLIVIAAGKIISLVPPPPPESGYYNVENKAYLYQHGVLMTCPLNASDAADDVIWERRYFWDNPDGNWTDISMLATNKTQYNLIIDPEAGGWYRCRLRTGGDPVRVFVNILSKQILMAQNVTANNGTKSAVLACQQNLNPPLPLKWYNASGVLIANDTAKRDNDSGLIYDVGNATNGYRLRITATRRYPLFTGVYRCQLEVDGRIVAGQNVSYYAAPDVEIRNGTTLSKRPVYHGANYNLTCYYQSETAHANVTWRHINASNGNITEYVHYRNDTNATDERVRFSIDAAWEEETRQHNQTVLTSILTINNVALSDEGHYECVVSNQHGNGSSVTRIRVISKYAAFWPFLGMTLFALVACPAILCYEKVHLKRLQKAREQPSHTAATQPTAITKTVIHEEITVRT
ncbi:basigin-like [Paramacrobiotus metropolitanus]|uniref:basigin-like n=1 Tax=Paramacrobiotus metropolitanus TaxID=2943436 RepID=UPI0024464203|nr:basigin-like [Paramacrobiotus metropolitanus]